MRGVWLLAGAGLVFALPLWAAGVDSGDPLPAVWKEQHMTFSYLGRTSRYSCEGLRDKMHAMLVDMGARRDLVITAIGCVDTTPSARTGWLSPSLNIIFSSPALPDPAAKPVHPGDLAAVDARYEPFTLTSDAFRNLGIADCELVEEFAHQVLPKLATRAVKEDISCVPYQASGSRFLLRGEILRALPRAEQSPGNQDAKIP
jgi:hypothetical protein